MNKNQVRRYGFAILLCGYIMVMFPVFVQDTIIGKWKTIDDRSGKERSIVEIYEQNGKLYGKVVQLFHKKPDLICKKCPGEKKNQKVLNMVVLEGLVLQKNESWSGRVLDPESGLVARCKVWREQNTLKVRGYLAFFFRTQTWYPVSE